MAAKRMPQNQKILKQIARLGYKSRSQFAREKGISRSTLYEILRGGRVDEVTALSVATALGGTPKGFGIKHSGQ